MTATFKIEVIFMRAVILNEVKDLSTKDLRKRSSPTRIIHCADIEDEPSRVKATSLWLGPACKPTWGASACEKYEIRAKALGPALKQSVSMPSLSGLAPR
jgi:hypothetical protein